MKTLDELTDKACHHANNIGFNREETRAFIELIIQQGRIEGANWAADKACTAECAKTPWTPNEAIKAQCRMNILSSLDELKELE